jgi:predicted metalloprotease with PDZ domain
MLMNSRGRVWRVSLAIALLWTLPSLSPIWAQRLDPIVYSVRIRAPETQFADIEAIVPTGRRGSVEIMMPIWSPGYYRVEDYAANVQALDARTPDGVVLRAEKTQKNRWRIHTGGAPAVIVSYRVLCAQQSVTTNWVGQDYAVLNGAPTFVTLVERARRPHEVQIELPGGWTHVMTGLEGPLDGQANRFRAADYEMLVDSPILAGKLAVHEFEVAEKPHLVVAAGDYALWNASDATRDLAAIVGETYRFWGFLPYEKYLFLLMFRQGGGGLEHRNSNLSTVRAHVSASSGRWSALGLLSHEYFHLFNVKRLRPTELGPFDFENPPTTGSLWISEGLTSYYSDLMIVRAGLQSHENYLASLSSLIGRLQTAPGRLLQSVEQSSREVWANSNSGVNPTANTVSYYNKGAVLGLLLDAKIQRVTEGRRSLDDVLRLAYQRYSGDRGYTDDEFRLTVEEVAGTDLREWFRASISTTQELDYTDVLEWYGLHFSSSAQEPAGDWTLTMRKDATEAQKRHLQEWLASSR